MFSIILAAAVSCGPTEIIKPKGYDLTDRDTYYLEYGQVVGCMASKGLPCLTVFKIEPQPDGSVNYLGLCDTYPKSEEHVQEKG